MMALNDLNIGWFFKISIGLVDKPLANLITLK